MFAIGSVIIGCRQKLEQGNSNNQVAGVPQFQISHADIVSISIEAATDDINKASPSAIMYLEFTKSKASLLHTFSQNHLNQKIQILVGANIVSEPVLVAVIPGDKLTIRFPSIQAAKIVEDTLQK